MLAKISLSLSEFWIMGTSASLLSNNSFHTNPNMSSMCKGVLAAMRTAWAISLITNIVFGNRVAAAANNALRCDAAPSELKQRTLPHTSANTASSNPSTTSVKNNLKN